MQQYSTTVSVVMAVYNGQKYLTEAIESILKQTFQDIEYIIVDDGSTDESRKIIEDYVRQDTRVRAVFLDKNAGLPTALNVGIERASGRYIARMDTDDISDTKRIEVQYAFMQKHPEVAICGVQGWYINESGVCIGKKNLPQSYTDIRKKLLWNNQLIHSSWFARKEIFENYQYNTRYTKSQDYELLLRLIADHTIVNLPERLIYWRVHEQSLSWSDKKQERYALLARYQAMIRLDYPWYYVCVVLLLRIGWMLVPQWIKKRRYDR